MSDFPNLFEKIRFLFGRWPLVQAAPRNITSETWIIWILHGNSCLIVNSNYHVSACEWPWIISLENACYGCYACYACYGWKTIYLCPQTKRQFGTCDFAHEKWQFLGERLVKCVAFRQKCCNLTKFGRRFSYIIYKTPIFTAILRLFLVKTMQFLEEKWWFVSNYFFIFSCLNVFLTCFEGVFDVSKWTFWRVMRAVATLCASKLIESQQYGSERHKRHKCHIGLNFGVISSSTLINIIYIIIL